MPFVVYSGGNQVLPKTKTYTLIDLYVAKKDQTLMSRLQASGKVICVFSAGSLETWQPDASNFTSETYNPKPVYGNSQPSEYWIDIRLPKVLGIMQTRMEIAKSIGCRAVVPTRVENYLCATGFNITDAIQITYNTNLSTIAHSLGLGIGLYQNSQQISRLWPKFDFALTENCLSINNCSNYSNFTSASKSVFDIESSGNSNICTQMRNLKIDAFIAGSPVGSSCYDILMDNITKSNTFNPTILIISICLIITAILIGFGFYYQNARKKSARNYLDI